MITTFFNQWKNINNNNRDFTFITIEYSQTKETELFCFGLFGLGIVIII